LDGGGFCEERGEERERRNDDLAVFVSSDSVNFRGFVEIS